MGGHDPYASSKGCAELVTSAYRSSFFSDPDGPRIASARAGNVIGGGDWGADRLVPDIMRAALAGRLGAGAQPQLDQAVAARAQPAERLPDPRAGAVRVARARDGLELRPGRRGRAPGRLDGRAHVRAVARRAALGARRGAAPARGPLPQARLLARARAARLAPAGRARRGARRASSTGTGRCATGPTCAPSRSGRSKPSRYAADSA